MHNAATSPVAAAQATLKNGRVLTFPLTQVQCLSDLPIEIRRDLAQFKLVDAHAA